MWAEPSSDEQKIVERMHAIRSRGKQHVAEMHHEVHRLVDWREHVRAQPLLAVGCAALLGYSLLKSKSVQPARERSTGEQAVAKASLLSGVMAFAGSMASNAIRQHLSRYVRNRLVGDRDDRTSSAEEPEQRWVAR